MLMLRLICTSKLNIKENFKMWFLHFLERSKYLAPSNNFFNKEMIYSEAGTINIEVRVFRGIFSKKVILRKDDYQAD